MKKALLSIVLSLVYAMTVFAGASSVTQKLDVIDDNLRILTMTWTGCTGVTSCTSSGDVTAVSTDAGTAPGGGSITDAIQGFWIDSVTTYPGTTAPTADYDITLKDRNVVDMMGGVLADRSATATQDVTPKRDSANTVYGGRFIDGPITLGVSGNSVSGGTGTVRIRLAR